MHINICIHVHICFPHDVQEFVNVTPHTYPVAAIPREAYLVAPRYLQAEYSKGGNTGLQVMSKMTFCVLDAVMLEVAKTPL